jgi:signal transduction histidine kinase
MKVSLENLVELSRLDEDARRTRHVSLPKAAAEVARQLREAARARSVEIKLAADLPAVEVNAAAFELCLSNLVANAIKYSDSAKPARWVEIGAQVTAPADGQSETVVAVRDNGLGVPEAKRPQLFERFFRAHEETKDNIKGTGLGLSIVRETVAALGGRAWAEFSPDGSAFFFSIPTRRAEDEEPAGTTSGRSATESDGRSAEGSPR